MIDPHMGSVRIHWQNAKWCLIILVCWAAGVIGLAVIMSRHVAHHSHRDQCVVCKPSGKLAMWGECE
jgi:hypothetical protein